MLSKELNNQLRAELVLTPNQVKVTSSVLREWVIDKNVVTGPMTSKTIRYKNHAGTFVEIKQNEVGEIIDKLERIDRFLEGKAKDMEEATIVPQTHQDVLDGLCI